jgi:hypothetical protein
MGRRFVGKREEMEEDEIEKLLSRDFRNKTLRRCTKTNERPRIVSIRTMNVFLTSAGFSALGTE